MKDSNWDECIKNNSVRKVSPDIERTKSLIEVANARIKLVIEINEENCNFVFEDYYTSIIELVQAITFEKGFNVLNHLCLGYYLRDILKREDLYRIFDDLRYKRNSLTYYGKRMDYSIAKLSINNCKKLIKEIKMIK